MTRYLKHLKCPSPRDWYQGDNNANVKPLLYKWTGARRKSGKIRTVVEVRLGQWKTLELNGMRIKYSLALNPGNSKKW